jgi:hypothetical protein
MVQERNIQFHSHFVHTFTENMTNKQKKNLKVYQLDSDWWVGRYLYFFLGSCHNQVFKELLQIQSESVAVFETQKNKMLPLRKT